MYMHVKFHQRWLLGIKVPVFMTQYIIQTFSSVVASWKIESVRHFTVEKVSERWNRWPVSDGKSIAYWILVIEFQRTWLGSIRFCRVHGWRGKLRQLSLRVVSKRAAAYSALAQAGLLSVGRDISEPDLDSQLPVCHGPKGARWSCVKFDCPGNQYEVLFCLLIWVTWWLRPMTIVVHIVPIM